MVKQGLLREDASPEELADARNQLLNPERNVELLAGKMARLLDLLNQTPNSTFNVSQSRSRAKQWPPWLISTTANLITRLGSCVTCRILSCTG